MSEQHIKDEFIRLLRERAGLMIKNHQVYELEQTITLCCQQFSLDPAALLEKLTQCTEQDPLFEYFMAGVTVGESYFFRDAEQFDLLEKVLLPELTAEKSRLSMPSIRIWSAGCATGEEIFSVAMLINEMGLQKKGIKIQLLATDINTRSLATALDGVYSEWSMRAIPTLYLNKYFTKQGGAYQLSKAIRDSVNFSYLNLNSENYPSIMNGTCAQDIILCRNVFIYFALDRIKAITEQLSIALAPGGTLLFGASDPVSHTLSQLSVCSYADRSYYKKLQTPVQQEIVEQDTVNINELIEIKSDDLPQSAVVVSLVDTENHAVELMKSCHWQELLERLHQLQKIQPLSYKLEIAKIKALANLGYAEKARHECQNLINHYPLVSELYYLLGLCQSEAEQIAAAEASFRKALYLDSNYLAARIQLGYLLLRKQDFTEGLRLLKTGIETLALTPGDQEVKDCPGINVNQLKHLLENELSLYKR